MTPRSPEHLCLLCLLRKANKKGSHFTPAGVLKHTIGPRNKEAAYTIDVEVSKVERHYGRENLRNTDTEITENPHVCDYIFCSQCESDLERLENEIIPILDKKIYEDKFRQDYPVIEITDSIIYKIAKRANPNIFSLFVYSLIWRICLQQRLEHHFCLVSVRFEETLRSVLNSHISKSILEIANADIAFPFSYIFISCEDIGDATATFVNPNIDLTNPYLFYVGRYLVLFYHEDCSFNVRVSTLPPEIVDKKYSNLNQEIKIVFITSEEWKKVNLMMTQYAANEYRKNIVVSFSKYQNISLQEASTFLFDEAEKLCKENGIELVQALNEVYETNILK